MTGVVDRGSWTETLAQHWQSVPPNNARHIDSIDRIELMASIRFRGLRSPPDFDIAQLSGYQ